MYEHIASGYREVARRAGPDLEKAGMLSRLTEAGGKGIKKTRVPDNDNAPLIPRGALIHFRSTDPSRLKPGCFVFLRRGTELSIRRFIRLQVTKTMLLIHVATMEGKLEKPVVPSAVLGHIIKVEAGGEPFDPAQKRTLKDYWTDYGTCSPAVKAARLIKSLIPARYRKVSDIANGQ